MNWPGLTLKEALFWMPLPAVMEPKSTMPLLMKRSVKAPLE